MKSITMKLKGWNTKEIEHTVEEKLSKLLLFCVELSKGYIEWNKLHSKMRYIIGVIEI